MTAKIVLSVFAETPSVMNQRHTCEPLIANKLHQQTYNVTNKIKYNKQTNFNYHQLNEFVRPHRNSETFPRITNRHKQLKIKIKYKALFHDKTLHGVFCC